MITDRIKERLYRGLPVFSFEFFPPKTAQGEAALRAALKKLVPLQPAFVSVTYGAGGSARATTRKIVCSIRQDYGLTPMAHLTCIGHTYDEIRELIRQYRECGITGILALRGDPDRESGDWQPPPGGPKYALDVVRTARAAGVDTVAVAGYPEKHPEAPDLETDLRFLKEKVDAGADFVITQLFFNNDVYFEFVRRAREIGVTVPIIPGIMPVTRAGQIEKFHQLSGCVIPRRLVKQLEACGDDGDRVREIGLAYCAAQCMDLLRRGAPGIHFFTLNQSRACRTVFAVLHSMGFWDAEGE